MSIAAALSVDNIVIIGEILLLRGMKWVKSVVKIFLGKIDLFTNNCQKTTQRKSRNKSE